MGEKCKFSMKRGNYIVWLQFLQSIKDKDIYFIIGFVACHWLGLGQ